MFRRNKIPILVFLSIVLIWELIVFIFKVPLYVLPKPSDIVLALVKIMPTILPHIFITMFEAISGILISVVLGLFFAFIMDFFPSVKNALYPLIVISQSIPILVIAPLLIIYFGFGVSSKICTVVLMCFFPIAINTLSSFEKIDNKLISMFRSLGANNFDIYKNIKLPGSLPGFFNGLRISASYSVTGAVVGEWLSSESGLGFYMLRAKNAYMLDTVFALVVLIILGSLLILGITVLMENIFMPYKKSENKIL